MIRNKRFTHKVPMDFGGKSRLRNYLVGKLPFLETASSVKKAIKKQQITIDGRIGYSGDWIHAGNKIVFQFEYFHSKRNVSRFKVFYEDKDLIILYKPAGILSSGNANSFQSQITSIEVEQSEEGALPYPYLIHRLDFATGGLMIAAKNIRTRRILAHLIDRKEITKRYILIVQGQFPSTIKWINEPIDGKDAKTEILDVSLLETKDPTSRITVQLHTGRTHQIRKHFCEVGYPLVGDQIYNEGGLTFGSGLLLCAFYLEFKQPNTGKLVKIECPIPTKISKYKPKPKPFY